MECYGCVRCRHNPLMMWLVERLVDEGMVETSVDEVDTEVGEYEEHRELDPVI